MAERSARSLGACRTGRGSGGVAGPIRRLGGQHKEVVEHARCRPRMDKPGRTIGGPRGRAVARASGHRAGVAAGEWEGRGALHRDWLKSYEAVDGELRIQVGKEEPRLLAVGEAVQGPSGVVHVDPSNESSSTAVMRHIVSPVTPAVHVLFGTLGELLASGQLDSQDGFTLLQLAGVLRAGRRQMLLGSPGQQPPHFAIDLQRQRAGYRSLAPRLPYLIQSITKSAGGFCPASELPGEDAVVDGEDVVAVWLRSNCGRQLNG